MRLCAAMSESLEGGWLTDNDRLAEDHGYVHNCPHCGRKCDSPSDCGCVDPDDEKDTADERDTLDNLGLCEDDFR
jgi:hypothetical protein